MNTFLSDFCQPRWLPCSYMLQIGKKKQKKKKNKQKKNIHYENMPIQIYFHLQKLKIFR